MLDIKLKEKLVEKILEEYREVETIILYGSYADGTNTSTSDLDIAVFANEEKVKTDTSFFQGIQLDLWCYPLDSMKGYETLVKLDKGVLLFDKDEKGKELLGKVANFLAMEHKSDPEELAHLESWCKKMIERGKVGDIEGNYRLTWLSNDILPIYFQKHNRWYMGPKKSLKWLKENDSNLYNLLERLYKGEKELLEEIVETIFR